MAFFVFFLYAILLWILPPPPREKASIFTPHGAKAISGIRFFQVSLIYTALFSFVFLFTQALGGATAIAGDFLSALIFFILSVHFLLTGKSTIQPSAQTARKRASEDFALIVASSKAIASFRSNFPGAQVKKSPLPNCFFVQSNFIPDEQPSIPLTPELAEAMSYAAKLAATVAAQSDSIVSMDQKLSQNATDLKKLRSDLQTVSKQNENLSKALSAARARTRASSYPSKEAEIAALQKRLDELTQASGTPLQTAASLQESLPL